MLQLVVKEGNYSSSGKESIETSACFVHRFDVTDGLNFVNLTTSLMSDMLQLVVKIGTYSSSAHTSMLSMN